MAGNRFDMIERAAARLRRDTPAQKPVIEQDPAAPQAEEAPPAAAPASTLERAFAKPQPDPGAAHQLPPQPANQASAPPRPQAPRQLINNLQPMPLRRPPQTTPPDD